MSVKKAGKMESSCCSIRLRKKMIAKIRFYPSLNENIKKIDKKVYKGRTRVHTTFDNAIIT